MTWDQGEFDRLYDEYADAGEDCLDACIHAIDTMRENENE